MSDRELLELAAKALGLNIGHYSEGYGLAVEGRGVWWNPLEDDAAAFRVANAKGISIIHEFPGYVLAKRMVSGEWFKAFVTDRNDYDRAARLAIVQVAAQIGKTMP